MKDIHLNSINKIQSERSRDKSILQEENNNIKIVTQAIEALNTGDVSRVMNS